MIQSRTLRLQHSDMKILYSKNNVHVLMLLFSLIISMEYCRLYIFIQPINKISYYWSDWLIISQK